MRWMTMVYGRENQGAPPQTLMDAIAKLGMEAMQAGTSTVRCASAGTP